MSDTEVVKPFLLRLPRDLKAWLKDHAKANSRNMTGQLIEIIKAERVRADQTEEA
jgi:hypothetical protein